MSDCGLPRGHAYPQDTAATAVHRRSPSLDKERTWLGIPPGPRTLSPSDQAITNIEGYKERQSSDLVLNSEVGEWQSWEGTQQESRYEDSLGDWIGREGTWLSLLFPPVQEPVAAQVSVAQRLLLVEPLEEAFAKLISADHDGAGGRSLDDSGEEACDGKTDHS